MKTKGRFLFSWCNDHIRRRFYVYPRLQYSSAGVSTGIIQPTLTAFVPLDLPTRPLSPKQFLVSRSPASLREHPGHVSPDSRVVHQALDATNGGDGNILVPELALGEAHHVAGGNGIDCSLNLAWAQSAASGDDLSADVLGQGGGAIQRQQDRCLQLGLGTLNLGLGDGLGKAGPLAQGEVDEVVDTGELVGDEVNTPETVTC